MRARGAALGAAVVDAGSTPGEAATPFSAANRTNPKPCGAVFRRAAERGGTSRARRTEFEFGDCVWRPRNARNAPAFAALRRSELIGRPLGPPAFVEAIGRKLGRVVTPGKRGPKPRAAVSDGEELAKTVASPK